MEPKPTKIIPFVEVTTTPSDYEMSVEWTLCSNPELTEEQNAATIQTTLISLWEYLCDNRKRKMVRPIIWHLHPHLMTYEVSRENYTKYDRNVFRTGINLQGICHLIYEMEKWYIPYEYGVELIKYYLLHYPVTLGALEEALKKHNPTHITMNRMSQHIRRFHRPSNESPLESELDCLCHDMYAGNFRPDYLSEAISDPAVKIFLKPIGLDWEEFRIDPVYLTSAKLYASLLIACMAITNDGKPVDNMCCIELWGALRVFCEEGHPRSKTEQLIHEIQLHKARHGCCNWHLVMTGG